MQKIFNAVFGDPNKKVINALRKDAEQISAFEPQMQALTDDQLKGKTAEFRERLDKGEKIDDIAFEAFAAVREASKRKLGQRHYDVQMMGGLVLHRGGIAEMRTGEGKTLTATAPLYLNALAGKGAHLVTVNDYLARRDAVWMGQVFWALGMTVGCIQHEGGFRYDPHFKHEHESATESEHDKERDTTGSFRVHTDYLRPVSRREAYAADITYGTNNEFGFDYLRDNMAPTLEQCVMGELHFAIVDEVDSILIDEARTPLIISAPAEKSNELYYKFARIAATLKENEDYNIDEKMRASTYTDAGIEKVQKALNIENMYSPEHAQYQRFAESALRAQTLFKRDVQYVVKDGEVIIVDEFTGRLMPGRRYSEGQHQAIEAKENLPIQRESVTLATITFQNFFRMYKKLGGMTGTAATEAEEFGKIYNLEVTSIPTNKDNRRVDLPDRVYKNELGKFQALVREIKERHEKGQPVLVGTISIEKNELLGALLQKEGIPFQLLNAKNHEREAEYIAQAGAPGAVTIATNMAGRGVDIMLGGNPPDAAVSDKVREAGGLHVIGTERHESRRIDNQLRGRSGRQGDPGSTQFYVSMEDDLMRIFGSDRIKGMMDKLGIPDDMPIENKMVTGSLEKAQQRVEGHHFDSRKHLLEYDDVLNKHREVIYKRRRELLDAFATGEPNVLRPMIEELIGDEIEQVVLFHSGGEVDVPAAFKGKEEPKKGDWNLKEVIEVVNTIVPLSEAQKAKLTEVGLAVAKDKMHLAEERTKLIDAVMAVVRESYDELEKRFEDRKALENLERAVILRAMDSLWVEHLEAMGSLRHGIGLQGYAQRDPLVEYKRISFDMFQQLLSAINQEIVYNFFKHAKHAADRREAAAAVANESLLHRAGVKLMGAAKEMNAGGAQAQVKADNSGSGLDFSNVGRNDPCPCGSGKKFKKCHGV